tara:strand:+ start:185 stop:1639 length:1455 start_codon:yes stop_codon:yes gene_type:complete
MPSILGANTLSSGFNIDNSIRFNGSDSVMQRNAAGTPSSTKIWSISAWVKRCSIGSNQVYWMHQNASNHTAKFQLGFHGSTDTFRIETYDGSSEYNLSTDMKFRDTSAWYCILVQVDSTQSTEANRYKIFVNGVQVDVTETGSGYPTQNWDLDLGSQKIALGRYQAASPSMYFDGYLADVVYADGQVIAPTDIGEFDEDSGIFKPIDVSGLTLGNAGFYINFADSSDLGATTGNDFALTNLAAIDQMTDTPTNNFATFNGNLKYSSTMSLAEGNLKGTTGSSHEAFFQSFFSTIGVSAGKWYAEFKVTAQASHALIGISADMESDANGSNGSAYSFIYKGQGLGLYGTNGKFFHTDSNTQVSYGSALSNDDIIGVAMDIDNQEVYFSENGTFLNSGDPTSGASKTGGVVNAGGRNIFSTGSGTLFFAVADFDQSAQCVFEANFGGGSVSAISSGNADANGHGNFEYAVPSGYFALCTKNLAEHG